MYIISNMYEKCAIKKMNTDVIKIAKQYLNIFLFFVVRYINQNVFLTIIFMIQF